MKTKTIRRLLFIGVAVTIVLAAFGLMGRPATPANANGLFKLRAPPFVSASRAEANSVASTIEDEAGVAAYFETPASITLSDVRDAFRTIEVETTDYIIGSVAVADYPESEDVHVYVHKDGWILAYYLAADPAAKVIDWRKYHNSGRTNFATKLETTIEVITNEAGFAFNYDATYYDFRYPNATHLMLIGEWVYTGSVTDTFEVKLPGSLIYYERSWSLGSWTPSYVTASYKLDGTTIQSWYSNLDWRTSQGTLTVSQLLPDQFHTIEVGAVVPFPWLDASYAYGGLALVYRVP